MDEAELRRGKVSVHKFFENYYDDAISGERKKQFGNSMAILAGDLLCAYAFECISKTKFERDKIEKVMGLLAETSIKTCQGQTMDIMSSELNRDLSESEYLELIENKTAEYTFKTPLLIGMILAGVEPSVQKKAAEYAELLGEAFQLRDDVMDIFSEEQEFGKKECGDITEGKKTLLVSHVFEQGSEEDILFIRSILGKKELLKKDILTIQKIFEKTGAKKKVLDMADEMIEKAKLIISETKMDKGTKIFFMEMADYLRERKS
jgi:geranylgeranyl diphosphate synthase type I